MASIERPKEEVMRETIEYAQLRDPDNQKPWVIANGRGSCTYGI